MSIRCLTLRAEGLGAEAAARTTSAAGISVAIEDGAEELILERGTHVPPRHMMALYTSVQWKTLCREVAKLALERPAVGTVVALRSNS